ncbi:MAG: hypothetical protein J0H98_10690 [Solirubrobacterales bacterium]|nr:hypothetical protein [Solirubrobacterales bacterium]
MLRKAPLSHRDRLALALFETNHQYDPWPSRSAIGAEAAVLVAAVLVAAASGVVASTTFSDPTMEMLGQVALVVSLGTFLMTGLTWTELAGYSLALFGFVAQAPDFEVGVESPLGKVTVATAVLISASFIRLAASRRRRFAGGPASPAARRRTVALRRVSVDDLSPYLDLVGVRTGDECAITIVTDYCHAKHKQRQTNRCLTFNDCSTCPAACVRHLELRK